MDPAPFSFHREVLASTPTIDSAFFMDHRMLRWVHGGDNTVQQGGLKEKDSLSLDSLHKEHWLFGVRGKESPWLKGEIRCRQGTNMDTETM